MKVLYSPITLRRDILGDGGVDAHFRGSRNLAVKRQRQRRIEGLRARVGNDQDIAVRLDPSRDRPFHVHRVKDIDVVVDDRHVLDVGDGQERHDRVLAVAGRLLDRGDDMPMAAAAGSDVDRRGLHAGLEENPARGRFVDRRAHPDILPGHLERVVHRVPAVHDGLDGHARVHVQAAHQPVELAERTFRMNPAFGENLAFQNDFGIGNARYRHSLAVSKAKRLAA